LQNTDAFSLPTAYCKKKKKNAKLHSTLTLSECAFPLVYIFTHTKKY